MRRNVHHNIQSDIQNKPILIPSSEEVIAAA